MKINNFGGIYPKVNPDMLSNVGGSQSAVNVDLYGNKIRPIREPLFIPINILDEFGNVFKGVPKTIININGLSIGFKEELSWCLDPRKSAGEDTFLFVRDEKVYRLSYEMLKNGLGPQVIGIDRPCEKPTLCLIYNDDCGDCEDCGYSICDDDRVYIHGYIITYLNSCNEESQPSPVEMINVEGNSYVSIYDSNIPPENAVKRRYYRSVITKDKETIWLYVGEKDINENTFIDNLSPLELGEPLPTIDHSPIPKGVKGVTNVNNNQVAYWSDKDLWLSHNGLPHAIDLSTRQRFPHKILFASEYHGIIENNIYYKLAVVTDKYPYLVATDNNGAIKVKEVTIDLPAVNSFGHCVFNGNLIYVSKYGLVSLSDNFQLITEDIMTENEWNFYNPMSVRLYQYQDKIIGKCDHLVEGNILFQFLLPQLIKMRAMSFIHLNIPAVCVYSYDNDLFFIIGNGVYKHNAGKIMLGEWHSPNMVGENKINLSSVRIDSDELPPRNKSREDFEIYSRIVGNDLDIDKDKLKYLFNDCKGKYAIIVVYVNGRAYYNRFVNHSSYFRIPRQRIGDRWSFKVISNVDINGIEYR